MARPGYPGDDHASQYNPGFEDDRDDRGSGREWRGEERWRAGDRGRHDGWGGLMFDDRDRGRSRDDRDRFSSRDQRGGEPGFLSRIGEQARSWFSDDDDDRRERGRSSGSDKDEWFGGRSGRERVSAHPDDHYRSWRDRQMQALDSDYREYCREREQQFQQDFTAWREQRRQRQSGSGGNDELMLDRNSAAMATDAPEGARATAGTGSETAGQTPESGAGGRR